MRQVDFAGMIRVIARDAKPERIPRARLIEVLLLAVLLWLLSNSGLL